MTWSWGTRIGIIALMMAAGCSSRRDDVNLQASFLPTSQNTPSGWPTPHPERIVSGGFGYRTDPMVGDRRFHKGLDIRAPKMADVVATADGRVVISAVSPTYGNFVVLDHGGTIQTLYAHLEERLVGEGAFVGRGRLIGRIGMTGRATSPHVHYEVLVNGIPVDPTPYLTP